MLRRRTAPACRWVAAGCSPAATVAAAGRTSRPGSRTSMRRAWRSHRTADGSMSVRAVAACTARAWTDRDLMAAPAPRSVDDELEVDRPAAGKGDPPGGVHHLEPHEAEARVLRSRDLGPDVDQIAGR